ncbi:MutS like protein 5 [Cucumispora dikerogammari]|nr:MutS like protein 5 [Cucumispora dikerogammari]
MTETQHQDTTLKNIMVLNITPSSTGSCIYDHETRSLTIFQDEINRHDSASFIRTKILKHKISTCLIQPTMDLKEYNFLHEMGVEISFGISNNIYNQLILDINKSCEQMYFTSIKLIPQLLFYIRKNFEIFDGQLLNKFEKNKFDFKVEKETENIQIGVIDEIYVFLKKESRTLRLTFETIKALELFDLQEHPNSYINVKNQVGVFNFLNFTNTKMGAWRLKQNLISPLISMSEINERHLCIEYFSKSLCNIEQVLLNIKNIGIIGSDQFILPCKKLYLDIKTLIVNFLFLNIEFDKMKDIPKLLKTNLNEKENEDIILLYNLLETNIDYENEKFLIKKNVDLELEQLRAKYDNIEEIMTNKIFKLAAGEDYRLVYLPQIGYLIETTDKIVKMSGKEIDDRIDNNINTENYDFCRNIDATKRQKTGQENNIVEAFTFNNKYYYKNAQTEEINKSGDLQTEIHLKELKILTEFNKKIPKYIILKIQEYFADLDFLFSLFLAKEKRNLKKPFFNNKGISLKGAILLNKKSTKLTIEINGPTLITGRNCSGKTTILKLLGQYTIMAQIGSFVPCLLSTQIFTNLFTKIICTESLIYNKSSYSSELLQIKDMIELKTTDSLFLVDELGKGTNENEAYQILETVLEIFSNKYLFVNVTNFQEGLKIPETYKCFQCFGSPKFQFMVSNFIRSGVFRESGAKDLIKRLGFSDGFLMEFEELKSWNGEESEEVKNKKRRVKKEINSFISEGL